MKEELAKTSTPQGEKSLERTYNGREGLGYVAPAKKKKKSKKKKSKVTNAKKDPIEGGAATKGPEISGGTPSPMDLQEKIVLTISCIVITMVMCMLSTMVPMMVMFIGLFGFPSPLLLT